MDGGAWWATVHGVAKSWTRLSDFTSLHFTTVLKFCYSEWVLVRVLAILLLNKHFFAKMVLIFMKFNLE